MAAKPVFCRRNLEASMNRADLPFGGTLEGFYALPREERDRISRQLEEHLVEEQRVRRATAKSRKGSAEAA